MSLFILFLGGARKFLVESTESFWEGYSREGGRPVRADYGKRALSVMKLLCIERKRLLGGIPKGGGATGPTRLRKARLKRDEVAMHRAKATTGGDI